MVRVEGLELHIQWETVKQRTDIHFINKHKEKQWKKMLVRFFFYKDQKNMLGDSYLTLDTEGISPASKYEYIVVYVSHISRSILYPKVICFGQYCKN